VICGAVLTTVVFGAVSLQRTFSRTSDGFRASADQMLVADYLSSDLRAAIGATVNGTGSNQTLAVTMPDYLDSTTRTPRTPTIAAGAPAFGRVTGTVDYGNPAAPVKITYSVSNGRLVRTEGNTASVLSKTLESFQLSVTDRAVAADFAVRFTSKFARQATNQPIVTVSDSVYFRNKQRN
jgi:hypothetical protein